MTHVLSMPSSLCIISFQWQQIQKLYSLYSWGILPCNFLLSSKVLGFLWPDNRRKCFSSNISFFFFFFFSRVYYRNLFFITLLALYKNASFSIILCYCKSCLEPIQMTSLLVYILLCYCSRCNKWISLSLSNLRKRKNSQNSCGKTSLQFFYSFM